METEFKNILAFSILMAGDRIMSKSPAYIEEKFHKYIGEVKISDRESWLNGLDAHNAGLFIAYGMKWFPDEAEPELCPTCNTVDSLVCSDAFHLGAGAGGER